MATSGDDARIEGRMCILVKDCIVRSTKAGDLVVVIDHIRAEDDAVEELTLLVYDQSAATAANIVARFYAKADGHTREEIQAKDVALRRAKTRTEPLNHAKLRAVHADYKKDLLGYASATACLPYTATPYSGLLAIYSLPPLCLYTCVRIII